MLFLHFELRWADPPLPTAPPPHPCPTPNSPAITHLFPLNSNFSSVVVWGHKKWTVLRGCLWHRIGWTTGFCGKLKICMLIPEGFREHQHKSTQCLCIQSYQLSDKPLKSTDNYKLLVHTSISYVWMQQKTIRKQIIMCPIKNWWSSSFLDLCSTQWLIIRTGEPLFFLSALENWFTSGCNQMNIIHAPFFLNTEASMLDPDVISKQWLVIVGLN